MAETNVHENIFQPKLHDGRSKITEQIVDYDIY